MSDPTRSTEYNQIYDLYNMFHAMTYTSPDIIDPVSLEIVKRLKQGGKVVFCGNGGSASDAQHLVGEFLGRYKKERKPYPAISLTSETAALTAIANDYSYDIAFKRMAEALVTNLDVFVAISTSGESANVLNAMEYVKRHTDAYIVGVCGNTKEGCERMSDSVNFLISIPSMDTPSIQTGYMAVWHCICEKVEELMEKDERKEALPGALKVIKDLDHYQREALVTAVNPSHSYNERLYYRTLGLAGEAGEVANTVKKILRGDDQALSNEKRYEIRDELGDVLWYLATLAEALNLPLSDIASLNIQKLRDRKERDVIKGSGDSR